MNLPKKLILFIIVFGILVLPLISAVNIDVHKKSSGEIYIPELDNDIEYSFSMTNNGNTDTFSIINYVSMEISPSKNIKIGAGETKNLELTITPLSEISDVGPYIFSYFIKGNIDKNIQEEKINFNIVPLKDVFEVGATNLNPESSNMNVYVKNKVNYEFKSLNANFESPFFDANTEFSLKPYETKNFTVNLDNERFEKLRAGFYSLNAEIKVGTDIVKTSNIINFRERDILDISEEDYGVFIHTKVIKKENKGNLDSESVTSIDKNIITRLFTSFSPQPDNVIRKGSTVTYNWTRALSPGDEIEIRIKTNWLFPLLIIFFIIVVVLLVKQYVKDDLVLKKKISFVRAKGGEFGLKVTITATAKSFVEDIRLIDRLPSLVKLHEKFLYEKPEKIDEKKRLIQWRINKLQRGEKRVFSYFIYSKVGVVGRFALPPAIAFYEREGDKRESSSNRAFFLADQKTGKEE